MMVVSVVFCITIIPTIVKYLNVKQVQMKWLSIIPLWIGLCVMGLVMLYDGYYLAGSLNIFNSFEWCFIMIIKIRWNK